MALSGRIKMSAIWLLSGEKRTSAINCHRPESDFAAGIFFKLVWKPAPISANLPFFELGLTLRNVAPESDLPIEA